MHLVNRVVSHRALTKSLQPKRRVVQALRTYDSPNPLLFLWMAFLTVTSLLELRLEMKTGWDIDCSQAAGQKVVVIGSDYDSEISSYVNEHAPGVNVEFIPIKQISQYLARGDDCNANQVYVLACSEDRHLLEGSMLESFKDQPVLAASKPFTLEDQALALVRRPERSRLWTVDRAKAYGSFAVSEYGGTDSICSVIGTEGRDEIYRALFVACLLVRLKASFNDHYGVYPTKEQLLDGLASRRTRCVHLEPSYRLNSLPVLRDGAAPRMDTSTLGIIF